MTSIQMTKIYEIVIETLKNESLYPLDVHLFETTSDQVKIRSMVEEAIAWGSDVLFTRATITSQLCKEIVSKRDTCIPQVFSGTGDPLINKLVESLDRPGNNITGAAIYGIRWIVEMIEKLQSIFPKASRVLIPYDINGLGGNLEMIAQTFISELRKAGMTGTLLPIEKANHIRERLAPLLPGQHDLMLVLTDLMLIDNFPLLEQAARRIQAPICVPINIVKIETGATFAYGPTEKRIGEAGAYLLLKVIESGIPAGDIPVNTLNEGYRTLINIENGTAQGMDRFVDQELLFIMQYGKVISSQQTN